MRRPLTATNLPIGSRHCGTGASASDSVLCRAAGHVETPGGVGADHRRHAHTRATVHAEATAGGHDGPVVADLHRRPSVPEDAAGGM